jgi:hypothetical protein
MVISELFNSKKSSLSNKNDDISRHAKSKERRVTAISAFLDVFIIVPKLLVHQDLNTVRSNPFIKYK